MKSTKFLAVAVAILILNSILVSASCQGEQVNINSAKKSELEKIKWIGPATAERIIGSRTFESIEGLEKVKYLGKTKIKEIKNESLACVENQKNNKENSSGKENISNEKTEENKNDSKGNKNKKNKQDSSKNQGNGVSLKNKEKSTNKAKKDNNIITLSNTKDIKNQTNKENSINKEKLSRYGLIGLTILVIFLFVAREIKHKKKYENEFGG